MTALEPTPPERRRDAIEMRAALEAMKADIDAALSELGTAEPTARSWERLAERIFAMAVQADVLGRRSRTAARKAHLEQR